MVIDIILVILFLIAALWGAHKGGIKIIASILSFVLAFVLAYVLAIPVGNYVKNTSFGTAMSEAIETRILNNENYMQEENNEEVSIYNENDAEDAITKIEEVLGDKVDNVINESKEGLANKITGYIFTGIGFLITFIVIKIILFVVFLIIQWIFELPVLKGFNKLTGCILEVILTLSKVWIVLGLISFMAPLEFMNKVIQLINTSIITKFLYDYNVIVSLIIGNII